MLNYDDDELNDDEMGEEMVWGGRKCGKFHVFELLMLLVLT